MDDVTPVLIHRPELHYYVVSLAPNVFINYLLHALVGDRHQPSDGHFVALCDHKLKLTLPTDTKCYVILVFKVRDE